MIFLISFKFVHKFIFIIFEPLLSVLMLLQPQIFNCSNNFVKHCVYIQFILFIIASQVCHFRLYVSIYLVQFSLLLVKNTILNVLLLRLKYCTHQLNSIFHDLYAYLTGFNLSIKVLYRQLRMPRLVFLDGQRRNFDNYCCFLADLCLKS